MSGSQDRLFTPKALMNVRGELIDISTPRVMGILNITPDSFYEQSRVESPNAVVEQAGLMLEEGADFLDLGAASSRPGARQLSASEEIDRLLPAVEAVSKAFPKARLSIDTWQSQVAREAIAAGGGLINDISAGELDPNMFQTVADLGVPYILMHMQGRPETMQNQPEYDDVVGDVLIYLAERTKQLRLLGVNDLVIDPGFGFGKTLEHNYALLKKLPLFTQLELPILVGVSRKSMINKVIGTSAKEALNGTTVLNTMALLNGAGILRVHDVKQAREAVLLVEAYQKA